MKRIKCVSCRFARPDAYASEGEWIAYECGNNNSGFYKCLVNIGYSGKKMTQIIWAGCEHGTEGRDST